MNYPFYHRGKKASSKNKTYNGYKPQEIIHKPRFIPPNGWGIQFENVYDFALNHTGHGAINAVAGAGKTSALVELAYRYTDKFPSHYVLAIAFNSSISEELKSRMPVNGRVQVFTCHAFGYKSVIQVWGDGKANFDLEGPKGSRMRNLAEAVIGFEPEKDDDRDALMQCVSLCKTRLACSIEEIILLMDEWGIETTLKREEFAKHVLWAMNETKLRPGNSMKNGRSVITYDDQVWLPIVNNWAPAMKYDLVLVDESQDLSPARKEIARRALKENGRMLIVGDKYQCVSVNSMINTPSGMIKITDLKIGSEVLSYRNGYIVPQKIKHILPSDWTYGLKVTTISGQTIIMSPNHRLWTSDIKNKIKSYIKLTAHIEDHGTAISFTYSEKNSELYKYDPIEEQQEWSANKYFAIRRVFENYRDGLNFAKELANIAKVEIVEKLSNELCGNLLLVTADQLEINMRIPVLFNGSLSLEPIISIEKIEDLFIDLDIDDASNFFSDGILSHNSIYSFAGADIHALTDMTEELKAKELPLTCSFRCAKNIIKEAQVINPDIEWRDGAEEGIVDLLKPDQMLKEAKSGDAIISRTNAPLVKVFFKMAKMGKRVCMLGRDYGMMLSMRVKSWQKKAKKSKEEFNVYNLLEKNDEWLDEQIKYLESKKLSTDRVNDEAETIRVLCEDLSYKMDTEKALKEVIDRIDTMFSQDEKRENKDGEHCVTLSSTHKFKGLERDRVFILKDTYRPGSSEEESNLMYTAITRAKKHLTYVKGKFQEL